MMATSCCKAVKLVDKNRIVPRQEDMTKQLRLQVRIHINIIDLFTKDPSNQYAAREASTNKFRFYWLASVIIYNAWTRIEVKFSPPLQCTETVTFFI